MPHCIIEFSKGISDNISVDALMEAVHQGAEESALFDVMDIKTRAQPYDYDYVYVADQMEGQSWGFIHIRAHILDGRTGEQKLYLSNCILSAVQNAITLSEHSRPSVDDTSYERFRGSLSVEVLDIHRMSYTKHII